MFPIITSICESVHECPLLTAKRKPTMMQQWSTIVDKEKILKSWLQELDRIVETISLKRTRSKLFNIFGFFSFFIFSSQGIVGVNITAILGFPDRNALLHFCIYSEPRSPDSLWVGHCCWLHMSTSRPILMHMSEKKSWPDWR